MAFIPVPNCVELVATYRNTVTNQFAKNVFGFKKNAGGITAADLTALKDLYIAWETDLGNNDRSSNIELMNVYIRELSTQNGIILDFPVSPAIAGARANSVLPMHTTLAVKHRTGVAGRSYRGRTYFIGLCEGDVIGDFVATARGDTIRAALQDLRVDASNAGTFVQVVISRQLNGVPREIGVGTQILGTVLEDYRVDTQRRRLSGAGE
jgi:hypothetical protein